MDSVLLSIVILSAFVIGNLLAILRRCTQMLKYTDNNVNKLDQTITKAPKGEDLLLSFSWLQLSVSLSRENSFVHCSQWLLALPPEKPFLINYREDLGEYLLSGVAQLPYPAFF